MKQITNLTIVIILITIISGCSNSITGKVINQETIKIGWIGPLTGNAAIIGEENLKGIQIAIDQINSKGGINKKQVELIVKDDQMDEKQTLTQYRQLVDIHNVKTILTVTYGGFLTLAEQADKDNVLLIDSLDASEELANLSNNAFAIGVYDESIGFAIADFLNNQEIEEVNVIFNLEDPFILLAESSFEQKFNGKIRKESFDFKTKDFRTVLTKLQDKKPLVLFGWEETGLIVKQAKELGFKNQIIGIDTFASENFKRNSNFQHEGLIFTFWQGSNNNKVFTEMLTSYTRKFGKIPENILFVAVGHDAMKVLANSLKNCKSLECTRNKLKNTKNFKVATGIINIDQDQITRSIKENMHTYKNGEIISL